MKTKTIQIENYALHGGGMFPEQYDVFLDGKEVGYFRLRHGVFTAQVPIGGETVYKTYTDGCGCFDNDNERTEQLTAAIRAVNNFLNRK